MELGLSKQIKDRFKLQTTISDLQNIIQFAESPNGLNLPLFPAQRFIFKVFYQIPLDVDLKDPIIIRDNFNEHIVETFKSEIDFFDFLYENKRINMSYTQWLNLSDNIRAIDFVCGRRATKSVMTSIIVIYQIYQLLTLENPHAFFNLPNNQVIGIQICSNKVDSAFKLFKSITSFITQSKAFSPFVSAIRAEEMWLQTQSFIDSKESGAIQGNLGNIRIASAFASPKIRGDSNLIVILDEIAHLRDSDTKGKEHFVDSDVYQALMPSTWGFVGDVNGVKKGFGKCFVLSSPNGKKGLLYERYLQSFDNVNSIMINTPSNFINTNLDSAYIRELYEQSELSYRQEFLGEFIDPIGNFLDKDRIHACFNLNSNNEILQTINTQHFVGVDLGLSNDRTAIAVCHIQSEPPIVRFEKMEYENFLAKDGDYYVIDHISVLTPNKKHNETLKIESIIDLLTHIYSRFKIYDGTFDQFSGAIFEQLLAKTPSINPLRLEPATAQNNNDRAVLIKRLINEGRLILPNVELAKTELVSLQEERVSNGLIKIHNPFAHDDIYSAITRALELAYRYRTIKHNHYIPNVTHNKPIKPLVSLGKNHYGKKSQSTGNPLRDLRIGILNKF